MNYDKIKLFILSRRRGELRCINCGSPDLREAAKTLDCPKCGCIHREDGWEHRIHVGDIEVLPGWKSYNEHKLEEQDTKDPTVQTK